MALTTNCPKCGGKLKTSVAEAPQQYPAGCSPMDDARYLAKKQQEELVINQMITQALNRSLSDVPDSPAIMLTDKQTQEQKRAFAANQAQMTVNDEEDTVPDPPAIMLAPVKG